MNGYGFAGGHKLASLARIPLAHEGNVIARVQSMRTRNGCVPEPLSFEASIQYLRNVERVRKHRVTVPAPRNSQCRPAPPPHREGESCAVAAQAGSPLPFGSSCDREHEHSAGRQSFNDEAEQ
jgi:hypothetical protein